GERQEWTLHLTMSPRPMPDARPRSRVIRPFEVRGDVFFREIRTFELFVGEQDGLVGVMRRPGVVALRIRGNAVGRGRRRELNGQDVAVASEGGELAVLFFLVVDNTEAAEIAEAAAAEALPVFADGPAHRYIDVATPQAVHV